MASTFAIRHSAAMKCAAVPSSAALEEVSGIPSDNRTLPGHTIHLSAPEGESTACWPSMLSLVGFVESLSDSNIESDVVLLFQTA